MYSPLKRGESGLRWATAAAAGAQPGLGGGGCACILDGGGVAAADTEGADG